LVSRWDIIVIGNLSRNRYWGESDAEPLRSTLCTTSLLRAGDSALLVDPAIEDADWMAEELDRRTGLKLADIDAAFVTHEHGDHRAGLEHLSDAKWLAAPEVAATINASGEQSRELEGIEGEVLAGVRIIHTPGHTATHHSLLVESGGARVLISGDAVMTRDFWMHRQGYFNSADFETAARTIETLRDAADIVVPGHDNCFLISGAPFTD
jgi:glyoxylase-like metal-dependent hydrolase (beta-lactamase superfamily II)